MPHCINISHPEITNYTDKFTLTKEEVGAVIAIWQEENNIYDRFPTIDEFRKEVIVEEVKEPIQEQAQSTQTIKEGVDFVFEQNPELAFIGSPEQYSAYLETIFPDSTVKDIVYRGGYLQEKENPGKYMYFTGILNLAKNFVKQDVMARDFKEGSRELLFAKINTINPKEDIQYLAKRKFKQAEEEGIDALYNRRFKGKPNEVLDEIVNFKPEQIHILGSKQDVEGFKEFVGKEDIMSSFRNMPLGDSLAREYETKLGLRNKDGVKKIFSSLSDRNEFFSKIPQSIKDEIEQNFIITLGKTMRGDKGISQERFKEFYTITLTRKGRNMLIDSTYGEFNKDEADIVKDSLLPQNNEELSTIEVIESLRASGLVSNELLDLFSDINVPVKFVELDGNTLFDTNGTVIRVNIKLLGQAHPQLVAEGLVHELVHIKTVNALENPQSEAEKFLSQRAKYLYNLLKRNDKEGKYGFTNEVEFVAELLAKPSFRNYVKTLENGNIWNKFVNFLADFFGIKRGSEKLIQDLEDYISKNNLTSDRFVTKRMEIINKTSELLADIIDNVGTRMKATEARLMKASDGKLNKYQEELLEKQKGLLGQLLDDGNNAKALQGILTYLENIETYRQEFSKRVSEIREDVEKSGNNTVFYKGGVIKSLGNFIYGNSAILEKLNTNIRDIKSENPELTKEVEAIDSLIKDLTVELGRLKKDYIDISRVVFAKFLLPFGMDRTLDHIEKVLSEPVEDLGFFTRWLDNLQESGDEALGMIDAALKHHYIQAQIESQSFNVEMLQLKKELEAAGIKDVEFMIKKDSTGKRTHYFVTERDIVRYRELVKETFDKLPNPEDTTNPEETLKKNKKIQSEFYRKNTISKDYSPEEFNELIRIKKEQLGENFSAWFEANSITNPTDGNVVIPLILDKSYEAIQSNELKSEYYWKVFNNKLEREQHLPASKRHLRRLPQIRKNFVERVKDGNWNRMYEGVKEGFQIKEDDTDYGTKFGLTDERGRVIQFLPIYFVEKIPNPDDISPDITSTIIAHNYHYVRRDKLALIVDLLEIGKDVIKSREVYKKSRGKVVESIKKFTGTRRTKAITIEDSELLKRLQTYLDMFVYGEMHKEGIKVMGIDIEKAVDKFGKYVWLRTLAGNVYATIANLNTGEVLAAMEAINTKYFDKGSLLYAEKSLELGLPGVMADISSRLPSRKLTIWTNEMDSMNNFEEVVFNMNAERKTKLGKFTTGTGLGFLSRMVEFRLHNKISLAVADTYRYNKSTGEFIFKNEYFKELEDLKNKKAYELKSLRKKQKLEVAELRKQGRDNEANELKEKYNTQMLELAKTKDDSAIKSLEDKLTKEWSEMTRFYDAHEVKNSRLVLKDEFKVSNYNNTKTRFIARQHGVNNTLQGMYAKLDTSAFQQKSIGRMVSMYRKWLMPAFNRRFAKAQTDFEKQMDTEGYYRAFGRFMSEVISDIKEHQFSLYKNWNSLTREEKLGAFRIAADLSFMLALAVLTSALMGDDDEDDSWAMNMMIYQVNRLFTEYGALTPPTMFSEAFKIVNSPAAAVNVGQELYYLISMSPFKWTEEIEKGKYKGMTRFERGIVRTFPMAETLYGLQFPEEKLKYFSTNR